MQNENNKIILKRNYCFENMESKLSPKGLYTFNSIKSGPILRRPSSIQFKIIQRTPIFWKNTIQILQGQVSVFHVLIALLKASLLSIFVRLSGKISQISGFKKETLPLPW